MLVSICNSKVQNRLFIVSKNMNIFNNTESNLTNWF